MNAAARQTPRSSAAERARADFMLRGGTGFDAALERFAAVVAAELIEPPPLPLQPREWRDAE